MNNNGAVINEEMLKTLERLSQLKIEDDKRAPLIDELEDAIELIKTIAKIKLDTQENNNENTNEVSEHKSEFREDVATNDHTIKDIIKQLDSNEHHEQNHNNEDDKDNDNINQDRFFITPPIIE